MEKLDRKDVFHVAALARLAITEKEADRYSVELNAILSEIDKIIQVEVTDGTEILISPTENQNEFVSDVVGPMLTKKEIFQNTNHHNEDYFVVARVIHD